MILVQVRDELAGRYGVAPKHPVMDWYDDPSVNGRGEVAGLAIGGVHVGSYLRHWSSPLPRLDLSVIIASRNRLRISSSCRYEPMAATSIVKRPRPAAGERSMLSPECAS